MVVPLDILVVLLWSASIVLFVVRGVRYGRRLVSNRAFPSMSFRGLIFKGLLLVWLVFSFLASLSRSEGYIVSTTSFYNVFRFDRDGFGLYLFLSLLLLAFVAMLLVILRVSLYILKLLTQAQGDQAVHSRSAALVGLGRSEWQRIRALAPTLLYSAVLFLVFYVAALFAVNVLFEFLIPRIVEISEGIRSETWLDECFIPLVVSGAFISLVIMYRKGWRGLGRGEHDPFSRGGWLSFSKGLLMSIGSRSVQSGLLWSLGVAYVIALASAFLLADLHPPPLPKVEVNEVAQSGSSQPGHEPAFEGKKLALLAHTEGYWYLIDEDPGDLLVVPDQDDKLIRLGLDAQPK